MKVVIKVKIKDHCHIIRKHYLSPIKRIPAVFHNLQNYDSNLIFQDFGPYNFKTNIMPKLIELIWAVVYSKIKSCHWLWFSISLYR